MKAKPVTPKNPSYPDFLPACQRLGECVASGHIRVIKGQISTKERPYQFCDAEAKELFNQALNSGVIIARQITGIGGQTTVYRVA